MDRSLIRSQVLPFVALFAALLLFTLASDYLLHRLDLVWIGRYLGIPGTILIIVSLFYSLRKHKIIGAGNPAGLLRLHETLTWLGALMVTIHAGIHFTAILPWLALVAMIVNVISGLVGRFLLNRSRHQLAAMREQYRSRGASKIEAETELFWDAVTFDLMAKWRAVHFPISYAFAVLALAHIVSIFLFWQWQ